MTSLGWLGSARRREADGSSLVTFLRGTSIDDEDARLRTLETSLELRMKVTLRYRSR